MASSSLRPYDSATRSSSESIHLPSEDIGYGERIGFQGADNSCYVNTLLYCMYGTTKVFERLFKPDQQQTLKDRETQKLLNGVIATYREKGYVEAKEILPLRLALEQNQSGQGERAEGLIEPATKIFNACVPSQDQSRFIHQIFFELPNSPSRIPTEIRAMTSTDVATLLNDKDDTLLEELNVTNVPLLPLPERFSGEIMIVLPNCSFLDPSEGQGWVYKFVVPNPTFIWRDPRGSERRVKKALAEREALLTEGKTVTAERRAEIAREQARIIDKTKNQKWPSLKCDLIGYATVGSYNLFVKTKEARGHWKAYSFDSNGDGYRFDSMSDQMEDETTIPLVEFLPGLRSSLENYREKKIESWGDFQQLSSTDQAARLSVNNLYACFYKCTEVAEAEIEQVGFSAPLSRLSAPSASLSSLKKVEVWERGDNHRFDLQTQNNFMKVQANFDEIPAIPKDMTIYAEYKAVENEELYLCGTGIEGCGDWVKSLPLEYLGDNNWMISCSSNNPEKAEFKIFKVDQNGLKFWEKGKNHKFETEGGLMAVQVDFEEVPAPHPITISINCKTAENEKLYMYGNGIEGCENWSKGLPLLYLDNNNWMISCLINNLKEAQFGILKEDQNGSRVWEADESHELDSKAILMEDNFITVPIDFEEIPTTPQHIAICARYKAVKGEKLYISGEGIEGGENWSRKFPLDKGDDDNWTVLHQFDLKRPEFKIIKVDKNGTEVWETGKNHKFDSEARSSKFMIVQPQFNA